MALLAEEIVEEWLNRQGYFTIRGIKLGVHEMDLLAIKIKGAEVEECRHIEVQASMRPVSYISRVPKEVQRAKGRGATSAKREPGDLEQGVKEWVEIKFNEPKKRKLMQALFNKPWSSELVIHNVKSEDEVRLIEQAGIKVHRLKKLIEELQHGKFMISYAAGANLTDLINMGSELQKTEKGTGTGSAGLNK